MGGARADRAMLAVMLVLMLVGAAPQAAALRVDTLLNGEDLTVEGRTTVLVEEMTATWCSTCADIDPYLAEVADRHGSRLALVSLHPMDGQDGVATNASEARLDRWRSVHDDLGQTPAFLVEGEPPFVGPEVWPDVTRRMLELESSKSARPDLGFVATRDGSTVHLELKAPEVTEGRQLTLMMLVHDQRPASFGVEAVKGSTYDRVLVELHTLGSDGVWSHICNADCALQINASMHASLMLDDNVPFSLMLIDETADANLSTSTTTHSAGAVELAVRPSSVATGADHRWALAAAMLAGGVAVAVWPKDGPESGRKNSEEE